MLKVPWRPPGPSVLWSTKWPQNWSYPCNFICLEYVFKILLLQWCSLDPDWPTNAYTTESNGLMGSLLVIRSMLLDRMERSCLFLFLSCAVHDVSSYFLPCCCAVQSRRASQLWMETSKTMNQNYPFLPQINCISNLCYSNGKEGRESPNTFLILVQVNFPGYFCIRVV